MRGQIENQENKNFFLIENNLYNHPFILHYSKIGRKRKISQAELAHDPLLI